MRKRLSQFLILFILITLSVATPAFAQTNSWQILQFESQINIQDTGLVEVYETITVDFKQERKHGIFRDIPYLYQQDGGEHYTKIDVLKVAREGQAEPHEVSTSDNHLRIKIGNPDQTISGKHTYTIHYTVAGIISEYNQYDELYWNVTGNKWEVPIIQAIARITLPGEEVLQAACYYGITNATTPCMSNKTSKTQAEFQLQKPLNPGEEFTIATGFTKNVVPILKPEKPKSTFDMLINQLNQPVYWASGALALIGGIAIPIVWWWKRGRDWWWRTPGILQDKQRAELTPWGNKPQIVVEFTPPLNLHPAQMGVLLDQKADTLDITSTIIDLASRGYLTIKELEKSWAFGSHDYELALTKKSQTELLKYESMLIQKMFNNKTVIKLSALKNSFYQDLAKIKQALYDDMLARKYFVAHPDSVRNKTVGLGFAAIIACAGLTFAAYYLVWAWMLIIAALLLIGGLGLAIAAFSMPQRTAEGYEAYRRTLGYKLFISTAEKYKQQFFERQNTFTEALPYAMMFGLTSKFAKAMEQIGYVPTQPAWYYGAGAFSLSQFSNDLDSVTTALSSTIASAPQSSGSGGGGSSGGGFGGGGGGSW